MYFFQIEHNHVTHKKSFSALAGMIKMTSRYLWRSLSRDNYGPTFL